MKKKILAISLLSLSALPLMSSSCFNVPWNLWMLKNNKSSFLIKETPFKNLANNHYNINSNSIKLYFKANEKQPYVSIEEMINKLYGLFNTRSLIKKHYNTNPEVNYINPYGERMVINYQNDYIKLLSDDFFSFVKKSDSTNYSRHLNYLGFNINNKESIPKTITLDLAKYNIDIVYENNKILIPLSVFNTLFCSQNYYNLYYNGSTIFGTFFDLNDKVPQIESLKIGNWNNEKENDIDRINNYNNLLFTLDYFYGLKDFKNIKSFKEYISPDLKSKLLSLDPEEYNQGYSDLFYKNLNELHTSMRMFGFFTNNMKKISMEVLDKSTTLKQYRTLLKKLKEDRENLNKEHAKKGYIVKNKTAYIIFNSFDSATNEELKQKKYEKDSFESIRQKLYLISNQHPEVKNVILDISQNGGGNLGAMIRVLGLLTNKDIQTNNFNTLSRADITYKYKVDANKDKNYEDKDAFDNFNYFILTGKNTFSAANAFAGVIKELKIGKIIGQKSGGGTSSIMPIVMQDGTSVIISSQSTSYFKNNDKNINLELGVPVDIEIEYNNFYNLDYLISKIEN
ncbi:hypothetical protein DMC14_000005 [Metamycoplasma phocicerebrale]|uniref:Tail specific protease domain-containing protein n=1 Tax=Metamycoplasma phocicerebrale TaxID=142649 RepID=A0A3Q9VBD0_9BACT|nr:S41 family peptidase [Metamycoplasma phocicerebrale]AZZ65201.1 hypothetical protein DMC14_000005 [Metamycoplasma phocicerebrale]